MLVCVASCMFLVYFKLCACVCACVCMNLYGADLQQPVKEDDADELVLGVSLADDEWERDGGRQLVAAVGLGQT